METTRAGHFVSSIIFVYVHVIPLLLHIIEYQCSVKKNVSYHFIFLFFCSSLSFFHFPNPFLWDIREYVHENMIHSVCYLHWIVVHQPFNPNYLLDITINRAPLIRGDSWRLYQWVLSMLVWFIIIAGAIGHFTWWNGVVIVPAAKKPIHNKKIVRG